VEVRLYPTEEQLREKRIRKEKLKLQLEVQGCTFKPAVNQVRGWKKEEL